MQILYGSYCQNSYQLLLETTYRSVDQLCCGNVFMLETFRGCFCILDNINFRDLMVVSN